MELVMMSVRWLMWNMEVVLNLSIMTQWHNVSPVSYQLMHVNENGDDVYLVGWDERWAEEGRNERPGLCQLPVPQRVSSCLVLLVLSAVDQVTLTWLLPFPHLVSFWLVLLSPEDQLSCTSCWYLGICQCPIWSHQGGSSCLLRRKWLVCWYLGLWQGGSLCCLLDCF